MKKSLWIIVLVLSIAMVVTFSFVGCKTKAATGEKVTTETVTEEKAEEEVQTEEVAPEGSKKVIAVIVPSMENPYWATMMNKAVEKAEELGYATLTLFHGEDVNRQMELCETCISMGVAAIILENADAEASVEMVQKAKDAGIPSFLVDREITQEGIAVSQIVANNYQGATILAEYFVKLMGEEGKYVELTGNEVDTNAHIRSQGYHDVIDQYPGMEMIAQQSANWSQTEAFDVMETILQTYSDIKGVIAGNDPMALGAYAALKGVGREDVIVVGFDANNDALQSVLRGELKATCLQPVQEIAYQAAIQADLYLRTGSTGKPEKQSIDMVLITPENADKYEDFAPKEG